MALSHDSTKLQTGSHGQTAAACILAFGTNAMLCMHAVHGRENAHGGRKDREIRASNLMLFLLQEDRSFLVSLTNMTDDDIAKFGPLPAGHERHRRGFVGPSSCMRLEALPPSAGEPTGALCFGQG